MEPKVHLCRDCGSCPSVEFRDQEVHIGEGENMAVLKREKWNVLVEKVRAGELGEL